MSGDELSFSELNSALLAEFPHLRESFAVKIGDFPGWEPGQYVVFGSIFNDYIENSASQDVAVRSRIAAFVERMAGSSDEEIDQLLRIELLPTFLKGQQLLDAYWPYFGPHAKRLLSLMALRVAPELRLPAG